MICDSRYCEKGQVVVYDSYRERNEKTIVATYEK